MNLVEITNRLSETIAFLEENNRKHYRLNQSMLEEHKVDSKGCESVTPTPSRGQLDVLNYLVNNLTELVYQQKNNIERSQELVSVLEESPIGYAKASY